jgi:hypothetical protein
LKYSNSPAIAEWLSNDWTECLSDCCASVAFRGTRFPRRSSGPGLGPFRPIPLFKFCQWHTVSTSYNVHRVAAKPTKLTRFVMILCCEAHLHQYNRILYSRVLLVSSGFQVSGNLKPRNLETHTKYKNVNNKTCNSTPFCRWRLVIHGAIVNLWSN